MSKNALICLVIESSLHQQKAKGENLAARLALPIERSDDNHFQYHLVYTDHHLQLQHNPHFSNHKKSPILVDFLHGRTIHTRLATASIKDPIAKAVGIKPGRRPVIADTTAGLGMDGVSLAWLGCRVILIERNPIIHALLSDGLERAAVNLNFQQNGGKNITLLHGNSIDLLDRLPEQPDTVLVDPMYPKTTSGALNKKEMRILREIVGDDMDSMELFQASLKIAKNRIVVKRPKGAELICPTYQPSHQILMKSGRFDVYLHDHL